MSSLNGNVNPFAVAQQWLSNQYEKGLREYHYSREEQLLKDTLAMHAAHEASLNVSRRETPTPSTTGAPIPGYRVRQTPTPTSTGAPMPGTLKDKTAIHPITGARVPRTPVKPKGKKPTPPGVKPKKK